DWAEVLTVARLCRTALDHNGLTAGPQVTGRGGVQVWVPVRHGPTAEQVRAWVDRLAGVVGQVLPDVALAPRSAAPLAPYAPVVRPGAPVSMPVDWDELDDLRPDAFTIRDVRRRLGEHGDPFVRLLLVDQVLPPLT
ncbi:MAG: ATP-dependent DNA ligase, partial [Nocardioidaceae bacterium]|nr:ATP-dependent DNA ligase [Nocardioidaceae bacterium]